MKKHVITISREYGSGGLEVGKRLAEYLDIPFYDRVELLKTLGEETPTEEELLEKEFKEKTSFIYNLVASLGFAHGTSKVRFEKESKRIEELYEEGSCVIVGRCGDYVLKGKPDVTSVFLFADEAVRAERAVTEYDIPPERIYGWMHITDRTRENYYNHYTGRKWGEAENYHLSINTEHIDTESIVKLIANYVELRG